MLGLHSADLTSFLSVSLPPTRVSELLSHVPGPSSAGTVPLIPFIWGQPLPPTQRSPVGHRSVPSALPPAHTFSNAFITNSLTSGDPQAQVMGLFFRCDDPGVLGREALRATCGICFCPCRSTATSRAGVQTLDSFAGRPKQQWNSESATVFCFPFGNTSESVREGVWSLLGSQLCLPPPSSLSPPSSFCLPHPVSCSFSSFPSCLPRRASFGSI